MAIQGQIDDLTKRIDAHDWREYAGLPKGIPQERKELLDARTALVDRLRFSDRRWRDVRPGRDLSINKILQDLASRNQAAIQLFRERECLIAVLLYDGDLRLERRTLSAHVKEYIDAVARTLESEDPEVRKVRMNDPAGWGVSAPDLLPRALLKRALQANSLLVVPHGKTHLLSWSVLPFEGRRLFEHLPVGIMPNLSSILWLAGRPIAQARAALIGAPEDSELPGADEEMVDLARLYGDRHALIGEPCIGPEATAVNLARLLKHPDAADGILHVASHGIFDPDDPMNSHLVFTDTKIDAGKIARMSVPFREIVLSACSTGRRPGAVGSIQLVGDDILGLPASFMEVGATTILVSVPEADDRTTRSFMLSYHRHRIDNMPPLLAFQATQMAMLTEGLDPVDYWAGFTLYGCH